MMMADTMEALGIARGQYVVKVNKRKVLDGVMEAIGLGGDENAGQRLDGAARDRQARPARHRGRARSCSARAARTRAATSPRARGSSDEQIDATRRSHDALSTRPSDVRERGSPTPAHARPMASDSGRAGRRRGSDRRLRRQLDDRSAGRRRARGHRRARAALQATASTASVSIPPSSAASNTTPARSSRPSSSSRCRTRRASRCVFGSVGGGGRYDGLVGRFRGEDVPATGFSIGVSRLQAALTALGKIDARRSAGPVVVTVMDAARIADYQRMVAEPAQRRHRAPSSISATSGMKAQMKYADRRNAPARRHPGRATRRPRAWSRSRTSPLGKAARRGDRRQRAWREERPGQFEVPRATSSRRCEDRRTVSRCVLRGCRSRGAPPHEVLGLRPRCRPVARSTDLASSEVRGRSPSLGGRTAASCPPMTDRYARFARSSPSAGYAFVEPPILHDAERLRRARRRGPAPPAVPDQRRRTAPSWRSGPTTRSRSACTTSPPARRSGGRTTPISGPVFRQRTGETGEFLQAGVESLGRTDRAAADADILPLALRRGRRCSACRSRSCGSAIPALFAAVLDALDLDAPWRRRLAAPSAIRPGSAR